MEKTEIDKEKLLDSERTEINKSINISEKWEESGFSKYLLSDSKDVKSSLGIEL